MRWSEREKMKREKRKWIRKEEEELETLQLAQNFK